MFFQEKAFLIFWETELSSLTNKKFQDKTFTARKIKKTPLKNFLIFRETKIFSPELKKFLYFF